MCPLSCFNAGTGSLGCVGLRQFITKANIYSVQLQRRQNQSLRHSLEQLVWLINIFRIFTFTLEMFLTTNFHFPNSQKRNECHFVQGKTCPLISSLLSFSLYRDWVMQRPKCDWFHSKCTSIDKPKWMHDPSRQTLNPQTKTLIMMCWPVTPEVRFQGVRDFYASS